MLRISALLISINILLAAPASSEASYRIDLTSREPTVVYFQLSVPRKEALTLTLRQQAELPSAGPKCSSLPLKQTAPRTWTKPAGCAFVHWTASIASRASADFDASSPISLWIARDRTWLLTSSLPWLKPPGEQGLPVQIIGQVGKKEVLVRSRGPNDGEIPVYIPIGHPPRLYRANGFAVDWYGAVPTGPVLDKLQFSLAATLSRWWRDIPPKSVARPDHFNFVWFGPSKGSVPGIFASAGSDALLIQYIPDPNSNNSATKLQAAVFGVGAHEALHSLFESVSGFGKHWATWAAETLPTYFAYKAARRHLKGPALALFRSEIINARADHGLLKIEANADAGDESEYDKLYGRGARFWSAIENALTITPNGSGKLAALIQHTNGMQGMDWRNAESVAAYLDRYSDNKASPIVHCFLVDDNCRRANQPIL